MTPLPPDLRKNLEKSVVSAREAAESVCEAALKALAVDASEAPLSLTAEGRQLRNALRAQQRQLGGEFEQLVAECAYEQWHLMFFARFLAENDLLMHSSGAHVTLDEVAELAREEGGSDPWLLAAHYAAAMLPGIFRPTDPCVRLPLAPEGRRALEDILTSLPAEVFTADDALGWVYQFWQSKKKKEVNASERKIGGADLAPVTQLFTEHYMVRFLLENSLGAWWAVRHPESPLLAEWEYLRYRDHGKPAAGCFDGWPETVAEITVMDPCCGSGHFLVAAFEMLRKMRGEEEGLSMREAADAVLRDNLYGLELDARCIQLGAFALALAAWRVTGYHELPSLNLACSGIPTRGSLEEWTRLAKGDERLERALTRLHELFREADTLGSLIDPRRAVEDGTLMSAPFEEVAPLLEMALANDPDPVAAVFGESAREVAEAASLLAGSFTLVATNVPYLSRQKQTRVLADLSARLFNTSKQDLATTFAERCAGLLASKGTMGLVTPQGWRSLTRYEPLRRLWLSRDVLNMIAIVGTGAFETISGEMVNCLLMLKSKDVPNQECSFGMLDVSDLPTPSRKAEELGRLRVEFVLQTTQLSNPDARIVLSSGGAQQQLRKHADSRYGLRTSDAPRLIRRFWELHVLDDDWRFHQGTVGSTTLYGGREHVLLWQQGRGALHDLAASGAASIQGEDAWNKPGVVVSLTGSLPSTLYSGESFDNNCAVVWPLDKTGLPALWAYVSSSAFSEEVRRLDQTLKVTNATLIKVPFDLAHWQKIAEAQYPNGLPEQHSDDPTQWVFKGNVAGSTQPLHVALARLLGYRWPDQEPDELDRLVDEDGIVCLPPVAGERSAHERLRELLVTAYGESFFQQTLDELLAPENSTTLQVWLRDLAFASHARLFGNRPFIWHVWDGRTDGFSVLVNYHKLDEPTLQKLTYTYLGWWIDRQRADDAAEVAGAGARLRAATELQSKLKLILDGECPYDIYVRWKQLAEQPLGWQPDLNDGVRLNIRPFVTAGVLRTRLSINWNKDRGKNADGSDRINDVHTTLAEKRVAREEVRASE